MHNLCREGLSYTQERSVLPSPFVRASVPPAAAAARRPSPGSLHVDGVRVLLAQGFVLLGVERLPLQIHMADLGQKTGRVTQAACGPEGEHPPKVCHPFRESAVPGRVGRQQPFLPPPSLNCGSRLAGLNYMN